MAVKTLTLSEFLLARIAEDEADARSAQVDSGLIDAAVRADAAAKGRAADCAHIARHDPARVLAECAAKRALVTLGVKLQKHSDFGSATDEYGDTILYTLAEVYADHPDYDRTWA